MILNLGCGTKTSPRCVNIDWSIHLRIARNPLFFFGAQRLLSAERVKHLSALRANGEIRVHNLARGIPFADGAADAVYHSHLFEHIDRNLADPARDPALSFLKECRRVLKDGGVLRIVVPDLEARCRDYLAHLALSAERPEEAARHDAFVEPIIGQAVRKEASGTSRQRPLLRFVENLLLGDARKRGETHHWEYDRVNLGALLRAAGFSAVRFADYHTSAIADWDAIGLDRNEAGDEYKPGSLYAEAIK
jgi:SAM-dependent methyltransferase